MFKKFSNNLQVLPKSNRITALENPIYYITLSPLSINEMKSGFSITRQLKSDKRAIISEN